MPVLIRDYETKSALDLTKVGAWRYSTHASTDAWCSNYAVDNGEIKLWTPGDPVPAEFIEASNNPEWLAVAFNDQFERLIEKHIMGPRYGWPEIPIAQHRCLQASALAVALPATRQGGRGAASRSAKGCGRASTDETNGEAAQAACR
jgi:DNA polymerase